MAISEHYKRNFETASDHQLHKAFSILCEKEVELEDYLKDIQEAKARIMIQLDIRNHKK